MTDKDARRAAERAARDSYGRLLAWLAARGGDIAAAEDALGDAFRIALETWPRAGVPRQPEAWLLTAARRRLIDAARHDRVRAAWAPALALATEERADADPPPAIPDERLALLFVCAHPSIAESARAPLMLQTAFGLDAAAVASAFLVSPGAMSQRLVRAKTRIRDGAIAFAVPEARELPARLGAVLDAIYAAYGSGWDDVAGADPRRRGLAEEAIWLARLTASLLPGEAEALGLLALLLHCEARRGARRDAAGCFVPLAAQDPARWSRPMLEEAERMLGAAAARRRMGPFQLEAAIQSAHAGRILTGRPGWGEIALLYEGLVTVAPTIGAQVGCAAALAEAHGPAAGLTRLDALRPGQVDAYQPYWALRAHLLQRLGRAGAARAAYDRALGATEDPAVRTWLLDRRNAVTTE